MARAFRARLLAGWPRIHWRPSTARHFLPPSSTIDQLPTTERNFADSPPAFSLDRSTCRFFAAATFFDCCAATETHAVKTAKVRNNTKRIFIAHLLHLRVSHHDTTIASGQKR